VPVRIERCKGCKNKTKATIPGHFKKQKVVIRRRRRHKKKKEEEPAQRQVKLTEMHRVCRKRDRDDEEKKPVFKRQRPLVKRVLPPNLSWSPTYGRPALTKPMQLMPTLARLNGGPYINPLLN
jgi:hypothetical protein